MSSLNFFSTHAHVSWGNPPKPLTINDLGAPPARKALLLNDLQLGTKIE
jgi:hypothetical protein